jgi:hypothetical protein
MGRVRYICPPSGGKQAVRSLENLPVKPEDVPEKTKQIAAYSPEQQYTPKEQREHPEKIKEALLKRPTSIHLDSPKEAEEDTEHDHLHAKVPDEAGPDINKDTIHHEDPQEAKGPSPNLKAVLKKVEAAVSEEEEEDGVKKSGPRGPRSAGHARAKARGKAPVRRSRTRRERSRPKTPSVRKEAHKAKPPSDSGRFKRKASSAKRDSPGVGGRSQTSVQLAAAKTQARSSAADKPAAKLSPVSSGPSELALKYNLPEDFSADDFTNKKYDGDVRQLTTGGFVVPGGDKTYATKEAAETAALFGGKTQSVEGEKPSKEDETPTPTPVTDYTTSNWDNLVKVNAPKLAASKTAAPGSRVKSFVFDPPKLNWPKSFAVEHKGRVVDVDTSKPEFAAAATGYKPSEETKDADQTQPKRLQSFLVDYVGKTAASKGDAYFKDYKQRKHEAPTPDLSVKKPEADPMRLLLEKLPQMQRDKNPLFQTSQVPDSYRTGTLSSTEDIYGQGVTEDLLVKRKTPLRGGVVELKSGGFIVPDKSRKVPITSYFRVVRSKPGEQAPAGAIRLNKEQSKPFRKPGDIATADVVVVPKAPNFDREGSHGATPGFKVYHTAEEALHSLGHGKSIKRKFASGETLDIPVNETEEGLADYSDHIREENWESLKKLNKDGDWNLVKFPKYFKASVPSMRRLFSSKKGGQRAGRAERISTDDPVLRHYVSRALKGASDKTRGKKLNDTLTAFVRLRDNRPSEYRRLLNRIDPGNQRSRMHQRFGEIDAYGEKQASKELREISEPEKNWFKDYLSVASPLTDQIGRGAMHLTQGPSIKRNWRIKGRRKKKRIIGDNLREVNDILGEKNLSRKDKVFWEGMKFALQQDFRRLERDEAKKGDHLRAFTTEPPAGLFTLMVPTHRQASSLNQQAMSAFLRTGVPPNKQQDAATYWVNNRMFPLLGNALKYSAEGVGYAADIGTLILPLMRGLGIPMKAMPYLVKNPQLVGRIAQGTAKATKDGVLARFRRNAAPYIMSVMIASAPMGAKTGGKKALEFGVKQGTQKLVKEGAKKGAEQSIKVGAKKGGAKAAASGADDAAGIAAKKVSTEEGRRITDAAVKQFLKEQAKESGASTAKKIAAGTAAGGMAVGSVAPALTGDPQSSIRGQRRAPQPVPFGSKGEKLPVGRRPGALRSGGSVDPKNMPGTQSGVQSPQQESVYDSAEKLEPKKVQDVRQQGPLESPEEVEQRRAEEDAARAQKAAQTFESGHKAQTNRAEAARSKAQKRLEELKSQDTSAMSRKDKKAHKQNISKTEAEIKRHQATLDTLVRNKVTDFASAKARAEATKARVEFGKKSPASRAPTKVEEGMLDRLHSNLNNYEELVEHDTSEMTPEQQQNHREKLERLYENINSTKSKFSKVVRDTSPELHTRLENVRNPAETPFAEAKVPIDLARPAQRPSSIPSDAGQRPAVRKVLAQMREKENRERAKEARAAGAASEEQARKDRVREYGTAKPSGSRNLKRRIKAEQKSQKHYKNLVNKYTNTLKAGGKVEASTPQEQLALAEATKRHESWSQANKNVEQDVKSTQEGRARSETESPTQEAERESSLQQQESRSQTEQTLKEESGKRQRANKPTGRLTRRSRRARRGIPGWDWNPAMTASSSPKQGRRGKGSPGEGEEGTSRERIDAAIAAAKARHEQVSAKDPSYSRIGTRRSFEDLIAERETEGEMSRARMTKSQSFVAPFARRVRNKSMSLKDALDKVPWHMQDELLEALRDTKSKRRSK